MHVVLALTPKIRKADKITIKITITIARNQHNPSILLSSALTFSGPHKMTTPGPPEPEKAVIVGISGPSSSGKTTLARLLQRIFYGVQLDSASRAHDNDNDNDNKLNTFIIHEDDFYYPDDQYATPTLTPPRSLDFQALILGYWS